MSRYFGGGASGRISRGMLPLLAFQVVSEYHRLGRKPPVTAGLILTNVLIYLRPAALDRILPTIDEVWFNPHLILKYGDLKRFFLSAFYHMGESHLVYNMMSLLWKGLQLETSMGSLEFASMVATLLGLSQGITLMMAKGLLLLFDYETAFYRQYSVGFSGVLFAMKVVLYAQADDYTYVHGMLVPSRHAAWAELILIQLFVPGVSFLGHLGGILAGLVYLRLRGAYFSRADPVAALIGNAAGIISWPLKFIRSLFRSQGRRLSGRGTVGGNRPVRRPSSVWRCPVCTFDNLGLLDVCEMCNTERGGGGFSLPRLSDRSRELSVDEVRRRRVERFDR